MCVQLGSFLNGCGCLITPAWCCHNSHAKLELLNFRCADQPRSTAAEGGKFCGNYRSICRHIFSATDWIAAPKLITTTTTNNEHHRRFFVLRINSRRSIAKVFNNFTETKDDRVRPNSTHLTAVNFENSTVSHSSQFSFLAILTMSEKSTNFTRNY